MAITRALMRTGRAPHTLPTMQLRSWHSSRPYGHTLCAGRPALRCHRLQASQAAPAASRLVHVEDVVEEEDEYEEEDPDPLMQSVVQVLTQHMVPNWLRPWEPGNEVDSSSSAFIAELWLPTHPTSPAAAPAAAAGEQAEAVAAARQAGAASTSSRGSSRGSSSGVASQGARGSKGHQQQRRAPSSSGAAAQREQGQERLLVLVTTAGAVEHARKVKVKRSGGGGREFPARVLAACPDADVALLGVDDERFWAGLQPLRLAGALPQLQEPIRAAGFGIGGSTFQITAGVVSRMEVVEYTHSGRGLLGMQVDAPLNNGVWGGPLVNEEGDVVGMAFQKFSGQAWLERYGEEILYGDDQEEEDEDEDGDDDQGGGAGGGGGGGREESEAEKIGQAIPVLLLRLVLEDATRALAAARAAGHNPGQGSSSGAPAQQPQQQGPLELVLPVLGIRWQTVESATMCAYLGLKPRQTGVRVTGLDPNGSAAVCGMRVGDVMVGIAGQPVAGDGTVPLPGRPAQRVLFGYFSSVSRVGDLLPVSVVREGQLVELQLRLCTSPPLVPSCMGPTRKPQYLVLGGLAFVDLAEPFMYEFDEAPKRRGRRPAPWSTAWLGLHMAMEWGLPIEAGGEQVVVLSEVLGAQSQSGTAQSLAAVRQELGATKRRLASLNGQPVLNLEQLAAAAVALSRQGSGQPQEGGQPEGQPAAAGAGGGSSGGAEGEGHLRLEFTDGSLIVLPAATLRADTAAVLRHHSLTHAMSGELRAALVAGGEPDAATWPFSSGQHQSLMQRRQARRRGRLALRR